MVNAEARRNQAEELLSDEQAAAVKGGKILPFGRIITFGRIFPIGKLMKPPTSSYSSGEKLLES